MPKAADIFTPYTLAVSAIYKQARMNSSGENVTQENMQDVVRSKMSIDSSESASEAVASALKSISAELSSIPKEHDEDEVDDVIQEYQQDQELHEKTLLEIEEQESEREGEFYGKVLERLESLNQILASALSNKKQEALAKKEERLEGKDGQPEQVKKTDEEEEDEDRKKSLERTMSGGLAAVAGFLTEKFIEWIDENISPIMESIRNFIAGTRRLISSIFGVFNTNDSLPETEQESSGGSVSSPSTSNQQESDMGAGAPTRGGGSPPAGQGDSQRVPAQPGGGGGGRSGGGGGSGGGRRGRSGSGTDGQIPPVTDVQERLVYELAQRGITSPRAVANILANIRHESNFNPRVSEDLNYRAEQILGVRPNVTPQQAADAAAAGPEAVGNLMYGNRMGNGPDEGYRYRGRGLIQITGKDNYRFYGDRIGVDLVSNPDAVNEPENSIRIAVEYLVHEQQTRGWNYDDPQGVANAIRFAGYRGGSEARARAADAERILQQGIPQGRNVSFSPSESAAPEASPSIANRAASGAFQAASVASPLVGFGRALFNIGNTPQDTAVVQSQSQSSTTVGRSPPSPPPAQAYSATNSQTNAGQYYGQGTN